MHTPREYLQTDLLHPRLDHSLHHELRPIFQAVSENGADGDDRGRDDCEFRRAGDAPCGEEGAGDEFLCHLAPRDGLNIK